MPNIPKTRKKSKEIQKDQKRALAQARDRLDKKRLFRDRSTHWAHFWNICPKCGGDMLEQKLNSIIFDVCKKCQGLYLDRMELELAQKYLDPKKFLSGLSRKAKKPTAKGS